MLKRYFAKIDAYLDNSLNEPYWLQNEPIASLVADSLHFIAKDWVNLFCFMIMPNHVHTLLRPKLPEPGLINIRKRHESFTRKSANKILGRSGQFWAHESYGHVVRNAEEFDRIVAYVLNNPVKARMVEKWEDFKWSWVDNSL